MTNTTNKTMDTMAMWGCSSDSAVYQCPYSRYHPDDGDDGHGPKFG